MYSGLVRSFCSPAGILTVQFEASRGLWNLLKIKIMCFGTSKVKMLRYVILTVVVLTGSQLHCLTRTGSSELHRKWKPEINFESTSLVELFRIKEHSEVIVKRLAYSKCHQYKKWGSDQDNGFGSVTVKHQSNQSWSDFRHVPFNLYQIHKYKLNFLSN